MTFGLLSTWGNLTLAVHRHCLPQVDGYALSAGVLMRAPAPVVDLVRSARIIIQPAPDAEPGNLRK